MPNESLPDANLESVINLIEKLSDQAVSMCLSGSCPSEQQVSALARAAEMMTEHQIAWPVLLAEAMWLITHTDACAAQRPVAAKALVASKEFQRIFRDRDDDAYTESIYRILLNRKPEPTAYEHWSDLLSQGITTREKMAIDFINSAEFAAHLG